MNIQTISINQELANFINFPQNIMGNPNKLYDLVETLCKQNVSPQIEYDGSNFCCHCQEFLIENNYKILPCGHNVHFECFKNYLIDQPFFIESIDTYSCCKESQACSQVIVTYELSKFILGEEQFNHLQNQLPFNQEDIIDHSDYQEEQPVMEDENKKSVIEEENAKNIQDAIQNDFEMAKIMEEQEKLIKKQQEAKIKFECFICFESFDVESEAITLECDHRFCKKCIQGLIEGQLNIGKFKENDLVCPQCNIPINFYIIDYCAPDCSSRITELRLQNLDNNNLENEKIVRCPGRNCPEQYYISKYLLFPICRTCKLQFCANGCEQVHEGMTCEQYKKKVRTKLERGLVECPKCQVKIFKDGGCNHITCKCKHEFCFVCSKPYKPKRECDCPQMTTVERIYDRVIGFFHAK